MGTDLFYLDPLKTIGQGASFTVKAVIKNSDMPTDFIGSRKQMTTSMRILRSSDFVGSLRLARKNAPGGSGW